MKFDPLTRERNKKRKKCKLYVHSCLCICCITVAWRMTPFGQFNEHWLLLECMRTLWFVAFVCFFCWCFCFLCRTPFNTIFSFFVEIICELGKIRKWEWMDSIDGKKRESNASTEKEKEIQQILKTPASRTWIDVTILRIDVRKADKSNNSSSSGNKSVLWLQLHTQMISFHQIHTRSLTAYTHTRWNAKT